MTDSETVQIRTKTISRSEMTLAELIVDLAWIAGFVIIGIGVVQAFSNPAVIVEYANGTLTIQGVTFRYFLAGIFLMSWRTGYQILQGLLTRFAAISTKKPDLRSQT